MPPKPEVLKVCLCLEWKEILVADEERKKGGETLTSEHMNGRKAYMYAFALLSGVGDLRSTASRMHLEEGTARG